MRERNLRLRIDTLTVAAERFDPEAFKRLLSSVIRDGRLPADNSVEARTATSVRDAAGDHLS
jgi:hypothetical protein